VNQILEEEVKVWMLIEEESIGSWFLFPEYTVMWLYAFYNKLNHLLKYVTPLLFAYEVLRKKNVLNEFHFVYKKKAYSIIITLYLL